MTEGRWVADPLERHEFRYWNGTKWTGHVSNAGKAEFDETGLGSPSAKRTNRPSRASAPDNRPSIIERKLTEKDLAVLAELRKMSHFAGHPLSPEEATALLVGCLDSGYLQPAGRIIGVYVGGLPGLSFGVLRPVQWFLTNTHVVTIESTLGGLGRRYKAMDLALARVSRDNYTVRMSTGFLGDRHIIFGATSGTSRHPIEDTAGLRAAMALEQAILEAQWELDREGHSPAWTASRGRRNLTCIKCGHQEMVSGSGSYVCSKCGAENDIY